MAIPIRNTVFDKIKEAIRLTDVELFKSLVKDEHVIAEDRFNKILLDLEILGLINVSWITKDERRIEVVVVEKEVDKIEEQNKETMEKDYEASFPGVDK
jgi:Cdc6-like AAA superfamily ATPase